MTEVISTNNESSEERMVSMSQKAFDALIGETKRETREKSFRDQDRLIEERVEKRAAEIAQQKAEEAIRQYDETKNKEAQEEDSKRQQADMSKVKARMNQEFQAASKKHEDFLDLANQYDWDDSRNQKILPFLSDQEIDNAGDILHYLMKEGQLDKLSLKSPDAIKKKVKEISMTLKKNEEIRSSKKEDSEPRSRTRPSHIPNKEDGGPILVGQFSGSRYRN